MKSYKHFVSVTAQVYFCSSPIRIDSYNRCQFGCTYCFARSRSKVNALSGLREANTVNFQRRLERVARAEIRSSLDEFLERRVPIQLGALQDPFSPMEESKQVTLRLMHTLKDHSYPTILSTKGDLFRKNRYLDLLAGMNAYVRLSAAGVAETYRPAVDFRCGSFRSVLERIRFLARVPIPVSLRIQPVIPGFEDFALDMAVEAAGAGAKHVSFEYLKLASESLSSDVRRIGNAVQKDVWGEMQQAGIRRIGRDYTLVASAKAPFVETARKLCQRLGITFGAGDTEFIHLSDGNSCCSGSSHFLRGASEFRANFSGILSRKADGELVQFPELLAEWSPKHNVHTYLATNSRGRDRTGKYSDWMSLLAHRWNGGKSPYSPSFFAGVTWTRRFDKEGYKIYQFRNPLQE